MMAGPHCLGWAGEFGACEWSAQLSWTLVGVAEAKRSAQSTTAAPFAARQPGSWPAFCPACRVAGHLAELARWRDCWRACWPASLLSYCLAGQLDGWLALRREWRRWAGEDEARVFASGQRASGGAQLAAAGHRLRLTVQRQRSGALVAPASRKPAGRKARHELSGNANEEVSAPQSASRETRSTALVSAPDAARPEARPSPRAGRVAPDLRRPDGGEQTRFLLACGKLASWQAGWLAGWRACQLASSWAR